MVTNNAEAQDKHCCYLSVTDEGCRSWIMVLCRVLDLRAEGRSKREEQGLVQSHRNKVYMQLQYNMVLT